MYTKQDTSENELYQRGLIITDDIAIHPILDFSLYTNAIVNIVKNSYPKFTIGLFGDWGTGKTTLMNSVYNILEEDNSSVLVRFETWRYEREEQFALIPLLKTIAFALPDEEKFQTLKQKLKRGAIGFLKKTPDIVSSIISKHISEEAGTITKAAIDSFRKEFNSKIELLAEVDRDTLYFDGFEDIRNEIKEIRQRDASFRIVVFVDDLDRCSPRKTLEVLESIKVFLGMEGFVYIIGLSHDVVTKLIDIEYKETGVQGEQYIKKIIQIPITLPKWNNRDITQLIQDFKDKKLIHEKYIKNIDEDLISTAVENNPRELKRFLNNFIIAYEIFSSKVSFNAKELLLIQAIQLRWNRFYNLLISSDEKFRSELGKYVQMDEETRLKTLDSNEVDQDDDKHYVLTVRKKLGDYKINFELWDFLRRNSQVLNSIADWSIYRRAVEVGIEPGVAPTGRADDSHVFISYAHEDRDKAYRLYRDLVAAGFKPSLEGESVLPGEKWKEVIENAIKNSRYVIALLSKQSVDERGHVKRELRTALDKLYELPENIYLIPARLDDCKIDDDRLNEFYILNLFPDWINGVNEMLRAMGYRV